jgi:hypothetical protein
VHFAKDGREDVAGFQVEVVPGAVKVCGHDADKICPILQIIALAHLHPSDLGDGVGLVGVFQRSSQKIFFLHGLGTFPGIDAGGTKEEEFFDSGFVALVDDVVLDLEILVDEFSPIRIVGHDPAHLSRGQEDVGGLVITEKIGYLGLRGQVDFFSDQ